MAMWRVSSSSLILSMMFIRRFRSRICNLLETFELVVPLVTPERAAADMGMLTPDWILGMNWSERVWVAVRC